MAIELDVVSNSKAAQNDMQRLRESVQGVQKSVEETNSGLKNFTANLISLAATTGSIAIFTSMSDSLSNISSRLKIVTNTQREYNKALEDTRKISFNTTSDLTSISQLYTKVQLNAASLGATQKEVAKVTENAAKAIALSGANAQETAAVVLQLGQALSSGRLQGDELRSILENAPILAKTIADGLRISIGQLRSLGAAGTLTSREVFKAIISQTDEVDKAFAKVNITYSKAFTNLGNAATVLFDSVQKVFTGIDSDPRGGLPGFINDLSIKLYQFARGLDDTVLNMRYQLYTFIDDALNGFDRIGASARKNFGGVGTVIADTFRSAKTSLFKLDIGQYIPGLDTVKKVVLDWVHTVERAFFWLYDKVIGNSWIPDLVIGVIEWTKKLLDEPVKTVLTFVGKINSAFSELFSMKTLDRYTKWMRNAFEKKKYEVKIDPILIKEPSELTKELRDAADTAKLREGAPLAKVIADRSKEELEFQKLKAAYYQQNSIRLPEPIAPESESKTDKTATSAMRPLSGEQFMTAHNEWMQVVKDGFSKEDKILPTPELPKLVDQSKDQLSWLERIHEKLKRFLDYIGLLLKPLTDRFNNSVFGHDIKQIFGIRDTTPGTYPDRTSPTGQRAYDNEDFVGRGPRRDRPEPFHNIINSLKSENQIPAIATMTAALGVGLATLFSGGGVFKSMLFAFGTAGALAASRFAGATVPIIASIGIAIAGAFNKNPAIKTLAAVLSTGFGLAVGNTVFAKEVSLTTANVTKAFVDGIKKAVDVLFGTGIFGERGFGGTLTLIAKLSLLFTAGREALGKLAIGVGTSPLLAVNALQTKLDASFTKVRLDRNQAQVASLPTKAADQIVDASKNFKDAAGNFLKSLDINGRKLSPRDLIEFRNGNNSQRNAQVQTFGPSGQFAATQLAAALREKEAAAQFSRDVNKRLPALISNGEDLKANHALLSKRVAENVEATKKATLNTTSGIGAVFGTLGGFNIGEKIAAQMVGYSDWAKVGVTMASAMVGQGIGAAIGAAIGSAMILAVSSPLVVAGLLIAGAIAAVFKIWSEKEWWGEFLVKLSAIVDGWLIRMGFKKDRTTGPTSSVRSADQGLERISQLDSKLALTDDPVEIAGLLLKRTEAVIETEARMLAITAKVAKQSTGDVFRDNQFKRSLEVTTDELAVQDKLGLFDEGSQLNRYFKAVGKVIKLAAGKALDFLIPSAGAAELPTSGAGALPNYDPSRYIVEPIKNMTREQMAIYSKQIAEFKDFAREQAKAKGLDPELVVKMFQVESAFFPGIRARQDPNKPKTSAVGIGQIQPGTAAELGLSLDDRLDPFKNMAASIAYLARMQKLFGSDPEKMLAGYHNGPGWTEKNLAANNQQLVPDPALATHLKRMGLGSGLAASSGATAGKAITESLVASTPAIKAASEGFFDILLEGFNDVTSGKSPGGAADKLLKWAGIKVDVPSLASTPDTIDEPQIKKVSEQRLRDILATIKDQESTLLAVTGFLKELGYSSGYGDLANLKPEVLDQLVTNIDQVLDLNRRIADGGYLEINGKLKILVTDLTKRNKEILDLAKDTEKLGKSLKSIEAVEAGANYAKQFKEDVTKGFADVLKGKASIGDAVTGVWDSFTNAVIDTFAKSLTNTLTKGLIEDSMASLISGVFSGGEGIGGYLRKVFGLDGAAKPVGGVGDPSINPNGLINKFFKEGDPGFVGPPSPKTAETLSSVFSDAWDNLSGVLSESWTGLGDILGKSWSFLSNNLSGIFSSIGGLFGGSGSSGGGNIVSGFASIFGSLFAASGGYITGPGTETSDSIPAMLSNREFVVNARSTSRFRPLLEAINSGSVSHFVDGGFVGSTLAMADSLATAAGKRNSVSSVSKWDLSITGDVSRQTRQEINRMIPQIAAGVNAHNYERGNRK